MKTAFINAKIYNTAAERFEDGALLTENGRITGFSGDADVTVDCKGAYMIPGLIDMHTHGRGGYEATDADAEGYIAMAKAYAVAGTTSFMPTMMSVPLEDLERSVDACITAKKAQDAADSCLSANILGIHLEGRYISTAKKGAHDPKFITPLDPDELTALIERSRSGDSTITRFHTIVAPELPGADAFIARAKALGATVSIGHSNATCEECLHAMELGADSYTHLFNAMSALTHRAPGCVGAALSTDAYAELISDGRHVVPEVVRIVYRAKAKDKLVLITDSVPPAGLPDGEYIVGGARAICRDGAVWLPDGTLNGSIISMYDALTRFMQFNDITLEEALPYATINPARLIRADGEVGSLEIGKRADFILLKEDKISIDKVYVNANEVK